MAGVAAMLMQQGINNPAPRSGVERLAVDIGCLARSPLASAWSMREPRSADWAGATGVAALTFIARPVRCQPEIGVRAGSGGVGPSVLCRGGRAVQRQGNLSAVFGSAAAVYGGGVEVSFRNGLYFRRHRLPFQRRASVRSSSTARGSVWTSRYDGDAGRIYCRRTLQPAPKVFPYFGAGIGTEARKRQSLTTFSKSHLGWLIVVGVEYRFSRLVGISGDVQHTRVRGIIGAGGASLEAGEPTWAALPRASASWGPLSCYHPIGGHQRRNSGTWRSSGWRFTPYSSRRRHAHHDPLCELKTPLHCTACTSMPRLRFSSAPVGTSTLTDFGLAFTAELATHGILLGVSSPGRSPPASV
jgi:hypothetical protein